MQHKAPMRMLEGQIAWAAARARALQVRRSGPQGHGSHSPTRSTHQEVKSACQALLERLHKTPVNGVKFKGLSSGKHATGRQAAGVGLMYLVM